MSVANYSSYLADQWFGKKSAKDSVGEKGEQRSF